MESGNNVATFKEMNQDVKLDKFDGTNFSCWKNKMMFILSALKISYMFDPNLTPLLDPKPDDNEQTKGERKKHEEDKVVCVRNYVSKKYCGAEV